MDFLLISFEIAGGVPTQGMPDPNKIEIWYDMYYTFTVTIWYLFNPAYTVCHLHISVTIKGWLIHTPTGTLRGEATLAARLPTYSVSSRT